jgi:hypothetical protein
MRGHFYRESLSQHNKPGFGNAVCEVFLEWLLAVNIDQIDDATTLLSQRRCEVLSQEQGRLKVDVYQGVEFARVYACQRRGEGDRSVINDNVQASERSGAFLSELFKLLGR